MSRRARQYALSRPWLQLRDATHPVDHLEVPLQMVGDPDEHLREHAWQQHEAEQAQQQQGASQ